MKFAFNLLLLALLLPRIVLNSTGGKGVISENETTCEEHFKEVAQKFSELSQNTAASDVLPGLDDYDIQKVLDCLKEMKNEFSVVVKFVDLKNITKNCSEKESGGPTENVMIPVDNFESTKLPFIKIQLIPLKKHFEKIAENKHYKNTVALQNRYMKFHDLLKKLSNEDPTKKDMLDNLKECTKATNHYCQILSQGTANKTKAEIDEKLLNNAEYRDIKLKLFGADLCLITGIHVDKECERKHAGDSPSVEFSRDSDKKDTSDGDDDGNSNDASDSGISKTIMMVLCVVLPVAILLIVLIAFVIYFVRRRQ